MEPVFVSRCCSEMTPIFIVLLTMFIVFVVLVVVAIKLLIFCKIFSKAGYSWALGLLLLIPVVNIIMVFYLAFADWPIRKELRRLKQQQGKS